MFFLSSCIFSKNLSVTYFWKFDLFLRFLNLFEVYLLFKFSYFLLTKNNPLHFFVPPYVFTQLNLIPYTHILTVHLYIFSLPVYLNRTQGTSRT